MDMSPLCAWLQVWLVASLAFVNTVTAEDFYELLGVGRSANTKEIRKAFKKLAVKEHPDKNADDPKAHERFLRINRAYEVLKDDELRKKYDMHGEEGLEDKQQGRHYESWQWYQDNFGIYDDDPEIITLSRSDFEQSVEGTGDIWFINYYSPHCSHCHDLAPTWREVARQLEGVIRIGAVNCEDDWQLCRMQGVRSYPSLIMYPQHEKYHGERSTKILVKYAMQQLRVKVVELWEGNFKAEVEDDESGLPWVITFCGEGGDCLEEKTSLKLAAMLEELVRVGSINCHTSADLCGSLDHEYGTYFYEANNVDISQGLELTSLVAQELARDILSQLPDVTPLDEETFKEIREKLETGQDRAWLIHFVDGEGHQDLELRKLPAMLADFHIGRVNCEVMREACRNLHIVKRPTFMVFKESGGSEMYYGRLTAHDLAAFARDSAVTKLEALGPQDFPQRVVLSQDPWFVDFFAPWCPPCMKLLPEFRKAAKSFSEVVNFGTVDCTVHSQLCNNYNIRSYPTTILYNQSRPHQFHGHHTADSIVEFLQDTLNPPVIQLNQEQFREHVAQKKVNEVVLVDFFAPWCGPCQQLAPEWRRLAKMVKNVNNLKVAQVDCVENKGLCQQESITSYPTMRLYPAGTSGSGSFHMYNGWHRDAGSLRAWAYEFLPSKVKVLQQYNFRKKVLESRESWIVDFYTPWCGHCQVFKPEFEKVAEQLEGVAHAGKVDCDAEPWLCQEVGVQAYPTVRFFQGADNSHTAQHAYGWDIQSQNADEIINFVKQNARKMGHDEL
ncbi:dnaJ homolog subfamily C member 10-like [Haliotis asinina]|uniref:dnaJ homolog subfamily C member 10-like n=1 Tax=Haliotis asinina TaxID=109174 RepID=UPI0035322763